jgi:hypothetical protein
VLRNVGAVFLALVCGNVTVVATEVVVHVLFPLGVDPMDEAALREAAARIPTAALVLLIVGWALAAVVEGAVAAKIATERAKLPCAMIVASLQTLAAIANNLSIPHPAWFWVSVLVFVPCAWLGARPFLRPKTA